jgi:hypothetical protein
MSDKTKKKSMIPLHTFFSHRLPRIGNEASAFSRISKLQQKKIIKNEMTTTSAPLHVVLLANVRVKRASCNFRRDASVFRQTGVRKKMQKSFVGAQVATMIHKETCICL